MSRDTAAGRRGMDVTDPIEPDDHLRSAEELRALLAAERRAREAAERQSRMKDEFISTVSHELRTPLNAIVGWTHVLLNGNPTPDDVRKALQIIDRNAKTQSRLISDLLDMGRILSGRLRLEPQPVDPKSLVETAVESMRQAADAKRLQMEAHAAGAGPRIQADPQRLQQVVLNLLSNAIKFTPSGGRVTVEVARDGDQLRIVVADTGRGISPDLLPHVFDRLRQGGDRISRREQGGLGLGLSIARQLVELHGGTIGADSPGDGLGTTVTVTIPAHEPNVRLRTSGTAALVTSSTLPPPEPVSFAGRTLLVVDDERDARDLIERLLRDHDATVVLAESAELALAHLARQPIDLIVSDISMPGQDGYELMRRIRALPASNGKRLPAVALTALARDEDRRRAFQVGYDAHLAKPVEPAHLLKAIKQLLQEPAQATVT